MQIIILFVDVAASAERDDYDDVEHKFRIQ